MKRLVTSSFFIFLLLCIGGYVGYQQIDTPQGLSLETFYRLIGQPVKTLDRSITRVLGVTAKNEQELGDVIAPQLERMQVAGFLPEKQYVNAIIQELAKQYNPKQLNYRVFIIEGPANAFAVAGGNLAITTGMLKLVKNEAQLIGILGHEKGHVDLGHCIDHMRIQAKTYNSSMGKFLDWYLGLMLNHTFSKFQENESDRFGFESLIALKYDPSALGEMFQTMANYYQEPKQNSPQPISDYFKTHPSLNIRAENWREKALRWKQQNPNQSYYIGQKNYLERRARDQMNYPDEWRK